MPNRKLPLIEVGYQVFASDAEEEFGAVREVLPGGRPELLVNIENAGDFVIPLDAVQTVTSQKVIVKVSHLDRRIQTAILHAHDREEKDL
jgi:hypothetical protein